MNSSNNLKNGLILLTLGGSRVCGLAREDSDIDVMGVGIPPQSSLYTLDKEWEQTEGTQVAKTAMGYMDTELRLIGEQNGCEGTVYNLRKYMSLAAKCNPTIWQTIFCRDEDVLYTTPEGEALRENAQLFVTQQARHAYVGYAIAQLKRIKSHKKWLDNPPTKPDRFAMGLPEHRKLLNKEQLSAFNTMNAEKLQELGLSDYLIDAIRQEKNYARLMETWKQFETWRKNRNPARAALEAKAHFDSKHGMHLARLLLVGLDIIKSGEVVVWRDDRDFLLNIRDGGWNYEKLIEWAERMIDDIEAEVDRCTLPKKPNFKAINKLYGAIVKSFYNNDSETLLFKEVL